MFFKDDLALLMRHKLCRFAAPVGAKSIQLRLNSLALGQHRFLQKLHGHHAAPADRLTVGWRALRQQIVEAVNQVELVDLVLAQTSDLGTDLADIALFALHKQLQDA